MGGQQGHRFSGPSVPRLAHFIIALMSDSKPGENLWLSTLASSRRAASGEKAKSHSVIVIGPAGAGKTSIVGAITGQEAGVDISEKSAATQKLGLRYFYWINGEDSEGNMEFWILEDALGLQSLLELALPASRLLNSTVLVVLDLARPWSLMLQLNTAVEFLNTYLRTLPSELLQQGRAAVERRFQTYAEPGTAAPTGDLPPLPAGVCEESLGVPLLVVVNKSDLLGQLSSELGYRADHWEFIQTALRRWCLARGAGLVFASGRKALNVALLGRYLRHVGLGAALPDAAQLAEKELLFVPAGWDSAARIEMDFRAQKLTNDSGLPYEEVLRPPPALRAAEAAAADTEALLQAEDDQRFLQTQLTILGSAPRLDEPATAQLVASAGPSAPTPATSPAAAVLAALSQPPSAEPPRTPSKLDARAGSASGTPTASSPQPEHQVLANFFNSLINKSSSPARKPAASLFSREEAEKELERLKGTPKKT